MLDKVEEELERATVKICRLYKQRYLQAKKIAYTVCRGINIIDKLDCVEKEEAKAKYTQIAEQSAETICQSSIEKAGSIVAYKAQLYTKDKVGIFNWSSMANNISNQLTFLNIPGIRGMAAGGLLKS